MLYGVWLFWLAEGSYKRLFDSAWGYLTSRVVGLQQRLQKGGIIVN
jgi:hypothetical protein